jgi:hypothetical protein
MSKRRDSPQWCMKHWAVIRDGDYNGIIASMLIMQAFIDSSYVAELTDHSAQAMQRAMEGKAPLCCWLGEEKMAEIYRKSARKRGEPPQGPHLGDGT